MSDELIETALPAENIETTKPKVFQSGPLKVCKSIIQKLSTNNNKRDPPSLPHYPKKTKHVRLITIGPSHYCEKVRWALDILEDDPKHESSIYYTEDAHPPLFQSIATLEASNNKASMTPMVIFEDDDKSDDTSARSTNTEAAPSSRTAGEDNQVVMYDSQKIMEHFCPFLYPPKYRKDILRLESFFGTHLGATMRCIIYNSTLGIPEHSPFMTQMLSTNASSVEKILFEKLFDKGISSGMKKVMNINDGAAQTSLNTLRNVFHEVSDLLMVRDTTQTIRQDKKKQFLMDNDDEKVGFTAADLAFSALASPLIQPPELELIMPPLLENDDDKNKAAPKELLQLRDELRNTIAGKHVLEMYRTQRIYPKFRGLLSGAAGGMTMDSVGAGNNTLLQSEGTTAIAPRHFVQPKVVNRDIRSVQAIKTIVSKL